MLKISFQATRILVIPVFLLLVLSACQSTRTATTSKLLKFNFEKGKGYDYEMDMNLDQEILGMPAGIRMTTYYSIEVKEDDGQLKTLLARYERFKMALDMVAMKMKVDTESPVDTSEQGGKQMEMLSRVLGAIKGKQFEMKVDAEGAIKEVKGFKEMAESIVESMELDPEKEKEVREEMKKKFGQQFNDEKIREQFASFLYIFPNKEVKVGDTWTRKGSMSGMAAGILNSTYKVTDIEGDMVTLEEKSLISAAGDDQEVSGKQEGILVVDSRNGLVVSADLQLEMKSKIGGMEIPIKGRTKIKGVAR